MTERNLRRILFPALVLVIAAIAWWFESRQADVEERRPIPRAAPAPVPAPEAPYPPRSTDDPPRMYPIPPKPPPAMEPEVLAPR